jgi:hypothetical protein
MATHFAPIDSAFLSFKHGLPDEDISDRLRIELRALNVSVMRLKDTPPLAGSLLSKEIEIRVSGGAALITLWSSRAQGAYWVGRERAIAKEAGLEECLVLFPGVEPPSDWPRTQEGIPDKVFELLRGVKFSRPLRTGGPLRVSFEESEFVAMARRIGLFVHTQAALRRRVTAPSG